MSEYVDRSSFEQPCDLALSSLMVELDVARGKLFNASAAYLRKPNQANTDEIVDWATCMASTTFRFIECILEDPVTDNNLKGSIIAALYIKEKESIAQFLNSQAGGNRADHFATTNQDELEIANDITLSLDILDEHGDEADYDMADLLGEISEGFGQNIVTEMGNLINLGYINYKEGRLNILRESIERHSFDILKIGAGVAIGSYLLKRLDKHQI